ncbi:MAG: tetratricopeptide repeat protein [Syntrophaceae bacterium]
MKDNHQPAFIIFFLIAIILITYWPVQHFEFANYDDDIYITENIHVCSGLTKDSIIWAITTMDAGFWHPLTWLSLMFDYELYRLNPAGYHWTNVLFHIANSILLFLVLNRMTGALWRSGFVAALFAVHPLHVESVAWIAERKDVLSTFFWMLTMYAYVFYVERQSVWRYILVFISFSIGLMAKPMLVTLPCVLLLLDYWPLRRFQLKKSTGDFVDVEKQSSFPEKKFISVTHLILEKAPLFVLVIVVSIVTYIAEQKLGALGLQEIFPLGTRLTNALISYTGYIGKMIWPVNLSVYYPHPGNWPLTYLMASCLILIIITIVAIRTLKTHPYFTVGWLWYLGCLVPVIGLIQVGSHAMADRYTYIPLTGLFIIVAWGVPDILRQWRHRRLILSISSGLVLVSLIMCTMLQVKYWENGISLFQHAVNITGDNGIILNNMGNALARKGKTEEAIRQYKKAINLQPNNAEAYNNLGKVLTLQGKINEAINEYKKVIILKPQHMKAYFNIGVAYSDLGNYQEAIFYYLEALKLKPDFVAAYNNLGIVYARMGDLDKAILYFQKAIAIFPNYESAKNNLKIAVEQKEAIKR